MSWSGRGTGMPAIWRRWPIIMPGRRWRKGEVPPLRLGVVSLSIWLIRDGTTCLAGALRRSGRRSYGGALSRFRPAAGATRAGWGAAEGRLRGWAYRAAFSGECVVARVGGCLRPGADSAVLLPHGCAERRRDGAFRRFGSRVPAWAGGRGSLGRGDPAGRSRRADLWRCRYGPDGGASGGFAAGSGQAMSTGHPVTTGLATMELYPSRR